MHRRAALALAGAVIVTACADNPTEPTEPSLNFAHGGVGAAQVTSNADAGPGSFREAIAAANGDPSVTRIVFEDGIGAIALGLPLVYSGAQPLSIDARGVVLDGSGLPSGAGALVADGGADLEIRGLTVRNAPGVGITVAVPGTRTGIQTVVMDAVTVQDNGLHGVLINDQAEYFIDPNSTSPAGSDASLIVRVTGSRFERNGLTALDQDGLRINEGGLGRLEALVSHAIVAGNGGDGVEFDERGADDVVFTVQHTQLVRNGPFSPADFDDGIDVDEAGDGHVIGRFLHVAANENFEQGIDLNENDAGDMRIEMTQVEASRNAEEGVELEEDDDFAGGGDIVAEFRTVTTHGNGAADGDAGLKLREKGDGDLHALVIDAASSDNAIGGILVREDAAGSLDASIVNATASGNAGHGIAFDENSTGNLSARIQRAWAASNGGAGVRAEQGLAGAGDVRIQALTAPGNTGGEVSTDANVTVVRIP